MKGFTLSTKKALELAEKLDNGVTLKTLLNWCEKYHIGYKIGGRWKISKTRLTLLLEGREWQLKEILLEEKRKELIRKKKKK